mgnify:CR=1 FL=1
MCKLTYSMQGTTHRQFFQSIIFILLAFPVLAQEKKDSTKAIPPAQTFVTSHKGNFGGKSIAYQATAREIYLKNDKGEVEQKLLISDKTSEGFMLSNEGVKLVLKKKAMKI